MSESLAQIIVALIGGGFLAGVGVLTYKGTRKGDREANAVTFSRDLMARLESLEDDVRDMRKDLDKINRVFRISLNFIERFMPWARAGAKPPIPDIPESLHEYLDPELIHEHRRQQAQQNPPDADPKA